MLSVVVPCFNEEKNLPLLAARFEKALHGVDSELLLVDNGSTDNSAEILRRIAKEYRFVRIVTVPKNIGYGHGILSGLKSAKGDILAFTHADMQCDPWDVVRAFNLYTQSGENKILVKGKRQGRFSVITSLFHIISGALYLRKFDDINGQPKLFHRNLMSVLRSPPTGFQLDFYIQYKARQNGYKVVSFPVKFHERKFGYSKWATSIGSRVRNIWGFFTYIMRLRLGD